MERLPSADSVSVTGEAAAQLIVITEDGNSAGFAPIIRHANTAFCAMFLAYSDGNAAGCSLASFFGERTDRASIERIYQTARRTGSASGGWILYASDGTPVWTEWTLSHDVNSPQSPALRLVGAARERRSPSERDMESLLAAVELADDAIFLYEMSAEDDEPRVYYGNGAAEIQTGYSREEFPTASRTGAETDPVSAAAIVDAIKRGEVVRSRQRYYRKDGSMYWAEVHLRPLLESRPGSWRWISVERDITEAVEREGMLADERDAYSTLTSAAQTFLDSHDREALASTYTEAHRRLVAAARPEAVAVLDAMYEATLRRINLYDESIERRNAAAALQAAQADAMALLAHDIRGPLNTVVGFAELLAEDQPQNTDLREYTRLIVSAANRVVDLTEEVLVASRLDRNEYEPAIERFDLLALIQGIVLLQPGGGRAIFDFVDDEIEIEADIAGVRHIVANVVGNALKYSAPAESVTVRVRRANERVHVVVEDHGIGVPPDELPQIFDRYSRASNAKRSKVRGTGLGLFFVKQLVERGGGTLDVASVLDEGTTVTITLPRSSSDALDLPIVVSLEPENDARSFVARELRGHGYLVRVVQTPEAAITAIARERTGLLIVDMDAYPISLLGQLAQPTRHGQIPLLRLVSRANGNAISTLTKPFGAGELRRKVEELLPIFVA